MALRRVGVRAAHAPPLCTAVCYTARAAPLDAGARAWAGHGVCSQLHVRARVWWFTSNETGGVLRRTTTQPQHRRSTACEIPSALGYGPGSARTRLSRGLSQELSTLRSHAHAFRMAPHSFTRGGRARGVRAGSAAQGGGESGENAAGPCEADGVAERERVSAVERVVQRLYSRWGGCMWVELYERGGRRLPTWRGGI
jgi:hypothetical protein